MDKNTGLRHNLEAPFRTKVPQNSLVYLEDKRCVMPDVMHMITRCIKSDLCKAAQKIVSEKPPYKVALQQLEDNCSLNKSVVIFAVIQTRTRRGAIQVLVRDILPVFAASFFRKRRSDNYKLKMMLVPAIMQAGFVRSPWHHMCEAMEKSNHHAHKDFQTKTMRGGMKLYNPDPLFHEGFFFLLPLSRHSFETQKIAVRDLFTELQTQYEPTTTYFEIYKKVVQPAIIEIGATRDSCRLLSGLWFHFGWTLLWNYCKSTRGYTYPFGGEVLSKDKTLGLSKRHSSTPNCFVVLKNDTVILKATRSEQCAASESDSDTCTLTN